MKREIAYLVNQYPAPSHTFIRREILALENLGWTVYRFTHRESEAPLKDAEDIAEVSKTYVLLGGGIISIVVAIAGCMARRPINTVRALALALRMAYTGERRFVAHLGYFVLACVLAKQLRQVAVTKLHAHFSINPADVAYLCHVICGVEFSLTFHATYEYDDPSRRLNLLDKITNASSIIVISEHGYRTLTSRFPEHCAKIKLIRCGLDNFWMDEKPTPVPDSNQLLCVARLEDQKNPALLIRASALLRGCGAEFRLVLVGDGKLRVDIERMIDTHNLSQHVSLAGWCDQTEIKGYLQESRALVLSSRSEGIPIAVLESFALGRPVIATDVGGVGEVVHTGTTGWLVPEDDLQALSQAMEDCLNASTTEMQKLADSARTKVATFSIEESARALEESFLHGGHKGEEP